MILSTNVFYIHEKVFDPHQGPNNILAQIVVSFSFPFFFLHKFQLVVVDKNCFSRNAFDYTIYDVITCTFSGRCIVTDTGDLT